MIRFYLLLCNILIMPVVFSSSTTVSKSNIVNNTSDSPQSNEPKAPLLSEGGSILPDTLALPKENHKLPSLDTEMGKSKIVARKGAFNYTEEVTKSSTEKPLLASSESSSIKPSTSEIKLKNSYEKTNTTENLSVPNSKNVLLNKTIETEVNKTKIFKKPLILNADLLENSLPEVKSSQDTFTNNQINSPNKDVKSYLTNANNHPGMVMPVVITILLVPMFAVLGYMALRRGQEAWKNRHYKRMDFLLDGMYND